MLSNYYLVLHLMADVGAIKVISLFSFWSSLHNILSAASAQNFYQPERAQARERLVLRLHYVFRVCLFVCASALITCAIYYVIRYYATACSV